MESLVNRSQMLPLLDPRELELILFSTEQCNFRCTYCYEDFAIGRMRRSVVQGVKRLIERRSEDLTTLSLGWFGGEPLVAKDVVFEVSEHAQRVSRGARPFRYFSHMTTNGSLLDRSTLDRLVNAGVNSYQISLDGWGEVHDVSRQRADGKGTFDRVWKNIVGIHESEHKLHLLVRVHLQPHNLDSVRELTSVLIREFGDDKRIDLFFKPVGNWGGPKSANIKPLSREEAARVRTELEQSWQRVRAHSQGQRLSSAEAVLSAPRASAAPETTAARTAASAPESASARPAAPPAPLIACYAARPNSLTVRADGRVGKCTVMLSDPRNDIGKMRPDGTIELNPGRLAPWMRGFGSGIRSELLCPAQNMPKQTGELLQVK